MTPTVTIANGIGIISGGGLLPQVIANWCSDKCIPYQVVTFSHLPLEWTDNHPSFVVEIEKMSKLFDALKSLSIDTVVFAGAMDRPKMDITRLDISGEKLLNILNSNKNFGDDTTLRAIISFFETNGFSVKGAHEIVHDLMPNTQNPTIKRPAATDIIDTNRAIEIVNLLGQADVGQGCVVAQGICLALESIQGTDSMLNFVRETRADYVTSNKGVLVKFSKPTQDLRVDMPTIGPETMVNASKAGLAGIVIEAGRVMVLDFAMTVAKADELDLFLWIKGRE